MKATFAAAVLVGGLNAVVSAECAADTCFTSVKLAPILNRAASIFCLAYVKPTPNLTTTKTASITVTNKVTPATPISTVYATAFATVTSGTVCSTTVAAFPTVTNFVAGIGAVQKRGIDENVAEEALAKRQASIVPNNLMAGCSHTGRALTSKISSACSCFLTPTATKTATTTITASTTLATPALITVTVTVTNTAIERPCTSTVTVGNGPATKTCGVPVTAYTSGSVSCPNNAPAGQSNQYFRIEGNDAVGTIFEGCIVAGPRSITTPSGGTHLCDGTQNNANPNPITTPTDMIDAAGRLIGFDFDGTYNTQFQDFFITRISTVAQTSNAFWGILDNYQFTPTGGCQYGAFPGSRILWAYDAFSRNAFLKVSPEYAAVAPGTDVSVTVSDGQSGNAAGSAVIAGATTDATGKASFKAPSTPGCYLYKATRSDATRSNTFYLSVF